MIGSTSFRGFRGGSFSELSSNLDAAARGLRAGDSEHPLIGFRLAMVPEPSTGLLVIAGLVALEMRRRVLD